MKQNDRTVWLMLADSVAFPAIVGLFRLFGYTIRVGGGLLYALAATALYIFCAVRLFVSKDKQIGKAAAAALSVSLLLDLFQTLFFTFYVFDPEDSVPAMVLFALWFWVAAAVVAVYVKSTPLKAVFYTLSGLLVLPVGLLMLLSGFGSVEVVGEAISPDKTWCAEVIEYDEGALGGSVEVQVYEYGGSFSVGSFEFRKDETVVCYAPWGSDRNAEWIDDGRLRYEGKTYSVPTAR